MRFFHPLRPSRSDSKDAEWAFVAPYLSLLPEEAVQCWHELRRGCLMR